MGIQSRLWILVFCTLVSQALGVTDPADVTALQELAKGWTRNVPASWNNDDPCGRNWQGIKCAGLNITELTLEDTNLQGTLGAAVGNLVHLTHLILSYNPGLTGPLPKELGKLVNLEYLSLQACSWTGSIPPELGSLKKLKFLGLNGNKLNGSLPPQLGGLSQCTWFDLSENDLSGELPVSTGPAGIGLDNLTSARHFHLNNNSFTGSVPAEISILPELIHLLVDSNSMNGTIPSEIGNTRKLEIIRLDNNKFSGPFPDLRNLNTTLEEVHIRNNSFTSFPDFSMQSQLLFLSLGHNNFPPGNLSSFVNLTKLQTLEIDQGNLVGAVPADLLALPSLETVSLQANNLNGTLDLGRVSQTVISIDLDNNSIADLSRPSSALFNVSLIGNPYCRTGDHPAYVDCNEPLPKSWTPNTTCTLSPSSCTGNRQLNPAACLCGVPFELVFQFNAPTFTTMTTERSVELRQELAVGVGVNDAQVWLKNFNFTENFRFIATVQFFAPRGQEELSASLKSDIFRRFLLHQAQLIVFDPYHVFPDSDDLAVGGGKDSGMKSGAIAGITIAAVLVAVAIGYAVFQKLRADKVEQASRPFASWGGGKNSEGAPVVKGVRNFTFAELKRATMNFSSSQEIGVGGYGTVYKGHLVSGEVVAIKRAKPGSMQGAHEFKTEIELLSRLHHRNLVSLVGFCYEQGEQMLVYEFMANGTISDHLLGQSKILSWSKRLEIALGAARGLSYLHELANPPVIHRDIKSSNILLDDTFVAKVADFGLSKVSMAEEGQSHVSTQVKGTLGYLDPEYYMTRKLTDKSDVYSFGVVLLELLTARPPIEEGKYVVREMKNALANSGLDSVIPLLDTMLEGYSMSELKRYLNLALVCVDEVAGKRPSMNEVVKELEDLLARILPTADVHGRGEFQSIHLYEEQSVLRSGPFEYSGGYAFPNKVEPK